MAAGVGDPGVAPWAYCKRCLGKGPVPDCRLCEQLNGRPMSEAEAQERDAALGKDHDRVWTELARYVGHKEAVWGRLPRG